MFHWICPECGREIAPTAQECPVCDPQAVVEEPALVGAAEGPPRALEANAAPVRALELRAAPPLPAYSQNASVPPPAVPAKGESLDPFLPQWSDRFSPGDPSAAFASFDDMLDETAAEPPPQARVSMPLYSVPPALRALIAELRPAGDAHKPVAESLTQNQTVPAPPLVTSIVPLPLRGAEAFVQWDTHSLAMLIPVAKPLFPGTPAILPAPEQAALVNYSPLAAGPLKPAPPRPDVLKTSCAPRVTLAGPMFTARLVHFADKELQPFFPEGQRARKPWLPAWLVTGLIAATALGAAFNAVFPSAPQATAEPPAVSQPRETTTAAPPTAASPEVAQASALPGVSSGSYSLVRSIEVSGFRIQVDPSQRAEIQYLVVNHSPSRFAGVTVFVTLRSATAHAGQAPLSRFSFAAPNLGPYEAKEMASAIEGITRPVALPEWQDLRADIEISQ